METPKDILIFTDYEPDDFVALWALSITHARNQVLVVVTENDERTIQRKAEDIAHFFPAFEVQLGATSDKERVFVKDAAAPERKFLWYRKCFQMEPHVIYALAPIRDILDVVAASPTAFRRSVMYAYGGFNFAKVLDALTAEQWTRFFADHFARVVVLETRPAFGSKLTLRTNGLFFATVFERAERDARAARLLRVTADWNRHIRSRMMDGVVETALAQKARSGDAAELGYAEIERRVEIARSIDRDAHQMVFADQAVVMVPITPLMQASLVPVSFAVDANGRFRYEDAPDSTLYLLRAAKEAQGDMHRAAEVALTNLLFPSRA